MGELQSAEFIPTEFVSVAQGLFEFFKFLSIDWMVTASGEEDSD